MLPRLVVACILAAAGARRHYKSITVRVDDPHVLASAHELDLRPEALSAERPAFRTTGLPAETGPG
jgi:hypothetical protein